MDAAPSEPGAWHVGERVLVRGRSCRIVNTTQGLNCVAVGLEPGAGEPYSQVHTLLTPFDRLQRLEIRRSPRILRPRQWLDGLRRAMAGMRPFGGLTAIAHSPVNLIPYQLEPALAVLRHGATRVLVADGVGMGKTIQAGVLLAELAAGSDLFRGLVIVPAGLKEQWACELRRHFRLDAHVVDTSWLNATAGRWPADVNPWALPGIYIASADYVKRPEVLRSLEDVRWDVLALDEAHTATVGSDRRAAAHAVASRSHRVILLTATPHGDDRAEFEGLCRIGSTPGSPSIVMFRRSRTDVGIRRPRRAVVLVVRPSSAERHMHSLLEQYTQRVWEESARRGDEGARLAVIVLRKRALSSAASLLRSVRRRMDLIGGLPSPDAEQLRLPLGDEDPLEDHEPDGALAAPGLSDARGERRWLGSIAEAAQRAARAETKLAFLLRLLRRIREPAIVFTEYRDTLTRLERAVSRSGRATATLHGGMSPSERGRVQRRFNVSDLTLIATDAAAEGLNLQSRCRIVVHYELPWRGSRLEQRAGRVDRLGQTQRVHEIALVAADTAERLVLAPLASRAAQAVQSGLDAGTLLDALTERRVAGLVMSGTPRVLHARAATPRTSSSCTGNTGDTEGTHPQDPARNDLRSEGEAEVSRLECLRRGPAQGLLPRIGDGPLVSAVRSRRSALPEGVLVIYRVRLSLANGRPVHEEPLWLKARLGPDISRSPRPRQLRAIAALFADVGLQQIRTQVDLALDQALGRVGPLHAAAVNRLQARARAIGSASISTAVQLIQAGLFDRRALREHSRRELTRRSMVEEPAHDLPEASDLHASVELAGLLVVTPRRKKR